MALPLRSYMSRTMILRGLAGVAVLYILIALFIAFTGSASLRQAEDTLASQKITVSSVDGHDDDGAAATHKDESAANEHHGDAHHGDSHGEEKIHSGEHADEGHRTAHSGAHQNANDVPADNAAKTAFVHEKDPLLSAPIEGLSEPAKDGHGALPKVSARGLTPFHGYKRSFSKTARPVVALAVRDFGLSRTESIKLLQSLPRDVSFVVSPYATHIGKWTKDARAAGHETWLYIPAQDQNYPAKDPGEFALLKEYGLQKSIAAMEHSLAQFTGYAGIAMDVDKTLLSSQTVLQTVLGDTLKRGLGYFELNSDAPLFFKTLATEHHAPYVQNVMGGAENLFANIEARAKTEGQVVAAIDLNTVNMAQFLEWVNGLDDKGFALAPLSAIAEGRAKK